jgi:hypothetical protein
MVRALLDGRKTQTRRICKVQPPATCDRLARVMSSTDRKCEGRLHWVKVDDSGVGIVASDERYFDCPYGVVGDRLYVRETWAHCRLSEEPSGERRSYSVAVGQGDRVAYCADDDAPIDGRWRPSIHMPRWASRITLEVTGVRVERLTDISEDDARAEGLKPITKDGGRTIKYGIPDRDGLPGTDDDGWPWSDWNSDPRAAFRTLWERINGVGSWDANPWTWVVEFKAVTP